MMNFEQWLGNYEPNTVIITETRGSFKAAIVFLIDYLSRSLLKIELVWRKKQGKASVIYVMY